MSDNLILWRAVEKTDPAFTKAFSRGGGFKGTAINATWLARQATAVFGPIGIGWGVEILDEALMEGALLDERGTRELIHKLRVKVWYVWNGQRGEVVQFGQTTFVGKNKFGPFTDEEAPKKSLTDGMTKCLSLIGFAADVHLGLYDDNKYMAEVTAEFQEKRQAEKQAGAPKITSEQVSELANLIQSTGADSGAFCQFFKVKVLADLPADTFARARGMLEKKGRKAEAPA